MTVDEAREIVAGATDIDLAGIAHVLMYAPVQLQLKREHKELAAAVLTLVVEGRRNGFPNLDIWPDYDWRKVCESLRSLRRARESGWLRWAADQAAEHYYDAGPDQEEFRRGLDILRALAGEP